MVKAGETNIYGGRLDHWRRILRREFVREFMKDYNEIDQELIRQMMSVEELGYKIEWVKK